MANHSAGVNAVATPREAESEFALVFDADESFALPLAVAMHSAIAHLFSAVPTDVCVLDNGLSESSRVRPGRVARGVQRLNQLRWLSVPDKPLANIVIGNSQFTLASYSRLLAPQLVPPHIRRILYLDSDVLVRRALSPLSRSSCPRVCLACRRSIRHRPL